MEILWRGGEEDTCAPREKLVGRLKNIYEDIFSGFYAALGEKVPVVLSRIVCFEGIMKQDLGGEHIKSLVYINDVFDELAKENDNISVFDIRSAPHYKKDESANGIFMSDFVHFTPQTNLWNAENIIENYFA